MIFETICCVKVRTENLKRVLKNYRILNFEVKLEKYYGFLFNSSRVLFIIKNSKAIAAWPKTLQTNYLI